MSSCRLVAAALAAFCGMAGPVAAQDVRVAGNDYLTPQTEITAAPQLTRSTISLADAVRLTVEQSPEVRRARQALAVTSARAQQARGAFDALVRAKPGFRYLYSEIAPFIRSSEDDKRRQLTQTYLAFDELNRQLLAQLQQLGQRTPSCPIGFTVPGLDGDPFLLDRLDPAETTLRGLERDLQSPAGASLEASLGIVRLRDICNPSPYIPVVQPELFLDFWRAVNSISGLNLNNILDTFSQFPRENVQHAYEISEAVSTRALLGLERLGALPQDEVRKNQYLELGWSKQFRSGLNLSAQGRYEAEERNFHEKSLDPSFGGFAVNPRFPSSVSFTTNMPLLKRRGATSNAAAERAAGHAIDAQRAQLRFTVASEVFRVVLAYLSLQANQATVRLLEESAARQAQLVLVTEARLRSGDVVRIEVDRVRARQARVASSLAGARANLVSAQIALVRAMGADLDPSAPAPSASDALSPAAARALTSVTAPLPPALAARQDLRSLDRLRLASQSLADGAASDLKHTLDFSLTAGLSTLYESPFYRYFPDEIDPILLDPRIGFATEDIKPTTPRQVPVRYFSWQGFVRSVRAEWQPFVQTSLSLRMPFGNNAAKGRFGQARASLSQSQIRQADTDRRIRANVVATRNVVERAARSLARIEESQGFQQTTLNGTLERFRQGDVTLIDTLTTEEDLTQGQIQLVQAWLGYAGALARLRFESGSLVVFDDLDQPGESLRFDPVQFLSR